MKFIAVLLAAATAVIVMMMMARPGPAGPATRPNFVVTIFPPSAFSHATNLKGLANQPLYIEHDGGDDGAERVRAVKYMIQARQCSSTALVAALNSDAALRDSMRGYALQPGKYIQYRRREGGAVANATVVKLNPFPVSGVWKVYHVRLSNGATENVAYSDIIAHDLAPPASPPPAAATLAPPAPSPPVLVVVHCAAAAAATPAKRPPSPPPAGETPTGPKKPKKAAAAVSATPPCGPVARAASGVCAWQGHYSPFSVGGHNTTLNYIPLNCLVQVRAANETVKKTTFTPYKICGNCRQANMALAISSPFSKCCLCCGCSTDNLVCTGCSKKLLQDTSYYRSHVFGVLPPMYPNCTLAINSERRTKDNKYRYDFAVDVLNIPVNPANTAPYKTFARPAPTVHNLLIRIEVIDSKDITTKSWESKLCTTSEDAKALSRNAIPHVAYIVWYMKAGKDQPRDFSLGLRMMCALRMWMMALIEHVDLLPVGENQLFLLTVGACDKPAAHAAEAPSGSSGVVLPSMLVQQGAELVGARRVKQLHLRSGSFPVHGKHSWLYQLFPGEADRLQLLSRDGVDILAALGGSGPSR